MVDSEASIIDLGNSTIALAGQAVASNFGSVSIVQHALT